MVAEGPKDNFGRHSGRPRLASVMTNATPHVPERRSRHQDATPYYPERRRLQRTPLRMSLSGVV